MTYGFVDIQADLSQCKKLVDELGYQSTYIVKDMMKTVGQKCKAKARTAYRKQVPTRTGRLYDSIVARNGRNAVVIEASARSSSSKVKYGYVLAAGHRKYKRKDGTEYDKQYLSPERYDFIQTPVMKYLESPKYKKDLDKALQKKIEKIEKKMGIRE